MNNPAIAAKIPAHQTTGLSEVLLLQCHIAPMRAARGAVLITEGDFADHSLLLLKGWIGLSKTLLSGETQIIDVMLPGDFALIGTKNVPVAANTAEALSDIEYMTIRPSVANGPEPAMARLRELMAASILTTQSRTSELLLRVGRGSAANRIAYALLEFYVRLESVGRTKGMTYDFPITQQKLGEFTGLTNVHVCRTLRRFEREGLISHPKGHLITLNDIDALCDLADINLEFLKDAILMRPAR